MPGVCRTIAGRQAGPLHASTSRKTRPAFISGANRLFALSDDGKRHFVLTQNQLAFVLGASEVATFGQIHRSIRFACSSFSLERAGSTICRRHKAARSDRSAGLNIGQRERPRGRGCQIHSSLRRLASLHFARSARPLQSPRPSWFLRPSRQVPLEFFSRPEGRASWFENCSRHTPRGNISPGLVLRESFYSRARAYSSTPPWETRAILRAPPEPPDTGASNPACALRNAPEKT